MSFKMLAIIGVAQTKFPKSFEVRDTRKMYKQEGCQMGGNSTDWVMAVWRVYVLCKVLTSKIFCATVLRLLGRDL